MGTLYRPTYAPPGMKWKDAKAAGLLRESSVYWCKYHVNGRPVRESTKCGRLEDARRFLKEREGRVAAGAPIPPRIDRIRYEELAADLRRHYETTGARDLKEAATRLAHLDKFFTQYRASAITSDLITRYMQSRQAAIARPPKTPDAEPRRVSNATINRELATLSRMLRLAYEHGKLLRPPVIKRLKESAPRQGFFEPEQYDAVRRRLHPDLQVATAIAHTFGWRVQSEVLTLERRQLDLEAGTLRLDAGTTKNDEGRLVYLTSELKALLGAQLERVHALEKKLGRIIPFLFPYLSGKRRAGERRRDFRKAWRTACAAAAVPGRFRHDFRRTAVRNMVNSGVPERVAMKVTGHKTRAVFDRYHIVSPADLQDVAKRLSSKA